MTLHLGYRSNEQQNEIREARRLLKERVRNDWDWPVLPAHQNADSGRRKPSPRDGFSDNSSLAAGGFRLHVKGGPEQITGEKDIGVCFEPVEWRHRQYSSADSDTDDTVDEMPVKDKDRFKFKFEGPDSVGTQILQRQQARKRKRQNALTAEMEWNDGLAHWTIRRDAWCCAHPPVQMNYIDDNKLEPVMAPTPSAQETAVATPTPTSSAAAETTSAASDSPRSSTSTAGTTDSTPNTTLDSALSSSPSKEASPESNVDHSSSSYQARTSFVGAAAKAQSTPEIFPQLDVLIPVSPTILPNHPVRRRITQSMYSEIYSKIIVQSRTPSVPINLLTLISALVKGWKDDGEWPPKQAGIAELSIGRRKKDSSNPKSSHGESSLKSGVKAVGRVLRLSTG